ncbi:MAG: iron-containing alcohol dehydrogenase [Rhizobiales bacterium]|nr:iron-containing alcohol dehydrogenase [Hyphomicrobiales bacterium]
MFTFNTAKSIVSGAGAIAELGTLAARSMGRRVAVVTDKGIVASGLLDHALKSLAAAGCEAVVFDEVVADPPEAIVLKAVAMAVEARVHGVVGFGGGSPMDVAKLVALLALEKEELAGIYGVGNARGPRLPLILVPTTAGTGSEVTPISIITTGAHTKMGVVSPAILPDIALLDPDLTLSVPPHVTAATGIDAMVHAIEAYTSASPNNNPLSKALAREALRLLGGAIRTAAKTGSDRQARADMLTGAMLAGQAFANSPVAAVHALAYPLGGHYHLPHGLTNALVLPYVLRFNAPAAATGYGELAPILFPDLAGRPLAQAADAFADRMAALSLELGLQPRLRDVKVPEADLAMLASEAMKQTRLLVNNPRPVAEADALAIYREAW